MVFLSLLIKILVNTFYYIRIRDDPKFGLNRSKPHKSKALMLRGEGLEKNEKNVLLITRVGMITDN